MNSINAQEYSRKLDLIRCVSDQLGRAKSEHETNAIIATLNKLNKELETLRGIR